MDLNLVPIHHHPQYLKECCELINAEWKRSETARVRSLLSSEDDLPTSLILLEGGRVIGHCKLSKIPNIKDACFIESVVIDKLLRGKGYGTYLMKKVEEYCKNLHLNTIYLSTIDQEGFYKKLGYVTCNPPSLYGSYVPKNAMNSTKTTKNESKIGGPPPPPMPTQNKICTQLKTFMSKTI